MRATGRLCTLLCALLALLPASLAQAKIRPLPKPAGVAAEPAAGHSGSLIAPVSRPLSRPLSRTAIRPARPHVVSHLRAAPRRAARALRRHRFVPVKSYGGRERPWRVLSSGGRDSSALVASAVLVPTPLGLVAAGEALPAKSYAWPAWKVALLTLLVAGEAFVLVRLTRHRRLAPASEI